MRTKFLIMISSAFLFVTCKKETPLIANCKQLEKNVSWATENFKSDYTIQFPSTFLGRGMVGFEGNTFYKTRADNKIIFNYSFCSSLYCSDFGKDLTDPNSSSMVIADQNGQQTILNNRINFCDKSTTLGIFYFKLDSSSIGKLFWKLDNKYQEALTVTFVKEYQTEVEQILMTIHRK